VSNHQREEQGNAVYKHRKVTKKVSNDPKSKEVISDTGSKSEEEASSQMETAAE
jgi:hypothetical protein